MNNAYFYYINNAYLCRATLIFYVNSNAYFYDILFETLAILVCVT